MSALHCPAQRGDRQDHRRGLFVQIRSPEWQLLCLEGVNLVFPAGRSQLHHENGIQTLNLQKQRFNVCFTFTFLVKFTLLGKSVKNNLHRVFDGYNFLYFLYVSALGLSINTSQQINDP